MNFDNNNPVPGENDTLYPSGLEPENLKPEIPIPAPANNNRFQRKEEPKNKQFTGRATETEAIRIQKAITAQGKGDIVRLLLACLNYIEADVLQTFKTK